MVSTGATIWARMRLIVVYVSCHFSGAGCGTARDCCISLGFRGDLEACFFGVEEPEPEATGPVGVSFPPSSCCIVASSSSTSNLTRLERRGEA